MRFPVLAAAFCWITASACGNGGNAQLDESTVNARIDSMVGEQTKDLIAQAEEDLDRRMSIEVKAKADSIVSARQTGATAAPVTPAPAPAQEP